MALFGFSGAVDETLGYGQRTKVRFSNTWAAGDSWTLAITSTIEGDITLGKGNIAGQTYTCAAKLRDRVFIGFGSSFALSSLEDPTLWEEQNTGAAVIQFLSQYGAQDTVQAFGVFEGKLVVFGRYSIQIWQTDANPANFTLLQTLDNSGTRSPLSVRSIGDLDVFYLEDSGVRSVRTKEQTQNAYINDVGTAIDLAIRDDIVAAGATGACAVVEPTTKQYWLYLNGKIYVLAFYPSSKIIAWSTYKPQTQTVIAPAFSTYQPPGTVQYTTVTGGIYYWVKAGTASLIETSTAQTYRTTTGVFVATSTSTFEDGTAGEPVLSTLYRVDNAFVPEKMVVHNGQIYIRGTDRKVYRYGGSDNNTFDYSRATVELPWLDLKEPSMMKQLQAVDAAFKGKWEIQTSTNPRAAAFVTAIERGSDSSPNMVDDSTFDVGRFAASGVGTHIKLKATSSTNSAAKLGKLNIVYKSAGEK